MSKPRPKLKVAIRAAINDSSTLELYFLDLIYNSIQFDWFTGELEETNMVEEVINRVKSANPSTIRCIIDSQGGDAGIGLAIYNFLKSYSAKVEVDILGMAGSIASVIAMAANKRKLRMARNAFMVIHEAWGGGLGTSNDLRKAADVVDRYTAQIVDIYSQRTGKTVEEIKALIADGDFWMNGTEAQQLLFVDELFNENPEFQIAARILTLDPHYHNVPQNLLQAPPAPATKPGKATPPANGLGNNGTSAAPEDLPDGDPATDDDGSGFLAHINQLFMDFKKQISARFKGGAKPSNEVQEAATGNGTPTAGSTAPKPGAATQAAADTAAEPLTLDAVMNAIEEPLVAILDEFQTELDGKIEKVRNDLGATISKLQKEKGELQQQLATEAGSETTGAPINNNGGGEKRTFGKFRDKPVDA